MLYGHIDTVGVTAMPEPFSATVRDGKLYGRGAYDMKGGVTACLATVKALRDAGATLRGDVLIACVADEEVASIGWLRCSHTSAPMPRSSPRPPSPGLPGPPRLQLIEVER
jgi:acetylornithine deacetylase/succinyl-diaminopimelate desuccinylase-like protein